MKKEPKQPFSRPKLTGQHIGDHHLPLEKFEGLDVLFKKFESQPFGKLNEKQKSQKVSAALLDLITAAAQPCFLLPAVLDFVDRVHREKILEHYNFSTFELWLNQSSEISAEENYKVRGLIMGKCVPRDEYQIFFPIGMGKSYPGSHLVTAHGSPDLDTTIASFWGWVDAFAARVADGLHIWNVPGGPPASQIEVALLFNQIFGENVFDHLAKTRTMLSLTSLDLMSHKGMIEKKTEEPMMSIDHQRTQNAIVLVDDAGFYLGDWRNFDVEGVRQVIMLLNDCLRWFENNLHVKLISLFAKKNLTAQDLPAFVRSIFGTKIRESEATNEFTEKQEKYLQDYLTKVLGIEKGLNATFEEFAAGLKELSLGDFHAFVELLHSLQKAELFDSKGSLKEDRPLIFHYLEKIIKGLDLAIQSVRTYVERLDVALSIKTHVFGYQPHVISYRADVEEIKSKMGSYSSLTVTAPDREGRLLPIGIVNSHDMHKPILGTVTLRDFCNREETKIPSYFEVISVIDHHKSALNTFSPPTALISDAQSSNALVAELSFRINDQFSTNGMTLAEIEAQIKEMEKKLTSSSSKRILKRLLQRSLAAEKGTGYFVHPLREFIEYFHFLYAILDDTDLLTKISFRDVEVVASLLNRLKSLLSGREVEVISLEDLPRDKEFVKKAAARILQNDDMYSLYRKIYFAKEKAVEQHLEHCAQGKPSGLFADTKEQNGCCRVGQAKMFGKNFPTFHKYELQIRKQWYEQSLAFYKDKSEVDLHILMISTIAGAEDLFSGKNGEHTHKDELWIWIPSTEQAVEHLKSFLNSFRELPQLAKGELELEFLGDNAKELDQIFSESFLPIPRRVFPKESVKDSLPIAVLRFKAGLINSRKAMISPFLPRLIS